MKTCGVFWLRNHESLDRREAAIKRQKEVRVVTLPGGLRLDERMV